MSERDDGPYPYVGKTISEVIHDYAVVRGDLVEKYARDQLVDLIERRIAEARREGAAEALNEVENLLARPDFNWWQRPEDLRGSALRLITDRAEVHRAASPTTTPEGNGR